MPGSNNNDYVFNLSLSPEEYFAIALDGMSIDTDYKFSATCPPRCECSLCHSLNKSYSVTTDETSDDGSEHGDDCPVIVKKVVEEQKDDGTSNETIDDFLPVQTIEVSSEKVPKQDDSFSSLLEPTTPTRVVSSSPLSSSLRGRDKEFEILELELREVLEQDRDAARIKLQLEIERDQLQLALEEAESAQRLQRIAAQKAKLDRIREDSDYSELEQDEEFFGGNHDYLP